MIQKLEKVLPNFSLTKAKLFSFIFKNVFKRKHNISQWNSFKSFIFASIKVKKKTTLNVNLLYVL